MAVQVNNDMQQSRLELLQNSPFRIEDVLSLSLANDFVGHPFKPLRSSKYIRLSDIEIPGKSESLTVAQWNCHLNSNHPGANPKDCYEVPTYETELKQKKFFFFKEVWGQTPLHVAVRNGRVDLCDLLILYGAEVDGINLNNETPLVTAIKANNSEMVKYLLESGANPNCSQCLHHAVSEGKQNLCQLLISYGAKVDAINSHCETPLVTAILANISDMVKYLLERGANTNCSECPFGILHVAVSSGKANLCLILIAYGAKVDKINGNGETPLVTAILANNSDTVYYLLESGADPNCAQCLHHAVSEGKQNLCQLLISYGAKVDALNAHNTTPLFQAIQQNDLDIVKYLLESGADPNYAQCLLHAVSQRNKNLCQLLISYGAKADALNACNTTPLNQAILQNDLDIVECFLKSGVDPKCAQCLHHAAREGTADMCRLLFSRGADLNAMNENNETPLMLAINEVLQQLELCRLRIPNLRDIITCNSHLHDEVFFFKHFSYYNKYQLVSRLLTSLNRVKYLRYQQIQCNVNVSSESFLYDELLSVLSDL
ncbi:hypothetical protein QYM36_020113 [Artemia franciscana]|uniref:Uncharacterized protein n=1 Tax=Artemia franciscana TaxID=6661 RepID=A0AA88H976_ARTSF|nr:hypothetical protein QYM36_020113 [Artemia franciscana]